jgi:serine/threonine protein phosphatase PrpC
VLDSAEEEGGGQGEKEHKRLEGGRKRIEEFKVIRLTSPLHLARGEAGKRTADSVTGVASRREEGGGKKTGGMDEGERQRLERDFGGKHKILEEGYLQPVHEFWWRQQLQLVRSLGHHHLQEFGVIPQPSIDVRTSEGKRAEGKSSRERERAIIVASDGLWDVVEEEEAIQVVLRRREAETEEAARQIANELVELAKSRAKTPEDSDDVTVVVVLFLDEKET